MNQALENLRDIPASDSLVHGYETFLSSGCVDDKLLADRRWDVFMALSSVRKFEFLFYPFKKDAAALVLNDSCGALAGAVLEKCKSVLTVLPTEASRQFVAARFEGRQNLSVMDSLNELQSLRAAFDYALVNLEGQEGWSLQGLSEFNNMLSPALDSLKDGGTLFLSLPAAKCREALFALRALKPFKVKIHDPFGNGLCLLEAATAGGDLADEADYDWSAYKRGGFCRSPLLESEWIRGNDIPVWIKDPRDQDWEKIQAVKQVQADLLKKLAQVCFANGLTLYPMYGTLLGLMRGGSYIDGDDDIDVALSREDYDKLLALGKEFSGQYFLQAPQSDDCFFGGYAKLRNSQTTAIHPQNWWADCNEGISIDIFPIDKASSGAAAERRKLKKIRFLQRLLYAYSYGYFKDFADMKILKWKFHKYFGKLTKRQNVVDAFDALLRSGDSKTKLAIYTHYRGGHLDGAAYFDAADFAKTVKMNFEGVPLDVPCGWENILMQRYGGAFFEIPPFNEFKLRHGFYDPRLPYGVWKKRFGGLKNPGSIKEPVILFGDGLVFAACLSYYKSRVNIPYLVLLPGEKKEEDAVCGIKVVSFEEFKALSLSRDSYRGVICSGDVLAADELLCQNGLDGLFVFWHDRNWMLRANQSSVWKDIRMLER